MFPKITSLVSTALIVAGVSSFGSASESQFIQSRDPEPVVNIQLCVSVDFGNCITVPVVNDTCVDLVKGLAGWNNEVSGVEIPLGYCLNCTFYDDFSCLSSGTPDIGDSVTLKEGNYSDFASIPGNNGVDVDFDNRVSSFRCESPLICNDVVVSNVK